MDLYATGEHGVVGVRETVESVNIFGLPIQRDPFIWLVGLHHLSRISAQFEIDGLCIEAL